MHYTSESIPSSKRTYSNVPPIIYFFSLATVRREKICKFFISFFFRVCSQGSDGNECILKMLCETGQRKHNEEPESMVIELLRTVFTYVFHEFSSYLNFFSFIEFYFQFSFYILQSTRTS